MFSKITGTLVERGGERLVLEAGGLGYEIFLPAVRRRQASATWRRSRYARDLRASLQMDGNSGRATYFGFTNAVEREFFEALITVASIGPRTAARAFVLPMARIARAIDESDHALLRTLPGIGQQKARDIVAKLQGKVARFLLIQAPEKASRGCGGEGPHAGIRGGSASRVAAARVQTQRSRGHDRRDRSSASRRSPMRKASWRKSIEGARITPIRE